MTDTSLGDLIDQAWKIREEIRRLEEIIKENKKALDGISNAIIQRLDADDLPSTQSKKARVRIAETEYPTIADPEEFFTWVKDNDALHLLQKRIAPTAYREHVSIFGEMPPGVNTFTKRTLSITTL